MATEITKIALNCVKVKVSAAFLCVMFLTLTAKFKISAHLVDPQNKLKNVKKCKNSKKTGLKTQLR